MRNVILNILLLHCMDFSQVQNRNRYWTFLPFLCCCVWRYLKDTFCSLCVWKFLLALKKASNFSSCSFVTDSILTRALLLCVIMLFLTSFFFKKVFLTLACVQDFGCHRIGGKNFFWALSVSKESDCTGSAWHGQHRTGRMKLIFGENRGNRRGKIPLHLIKGEILSLQKASAKQLCFTSPKLKASLLLRDRLRGL